VSAVGNTLPAAAETVYVVQDEVSTDALTRSLQALVPTRHHPIARRRFTVLDTFDGRVRRAGACLTRAGVNGSSTLRWQPRGGGNLSVRLTEPIAFAWDLPDGPLQRTLTSVIGPRRLLAQADAEEYGSELDILDDLGKTIARLRIASGQARLPQASGGWLTLPATVTLTGLRGYEKAYRRLVPIIESRPGIRSCAESRVAVMLRRVGAPLRGDLSSPSVDLAPTVRAEVGARRIHAALVDVLLINEPGVRANLDTEFLHDFRVTVRRTRSLLGQIKKVFPQDVVQHFAAEFSWIGHLTGPPRDLDVLVLSLRERRGEFSAVDVEPLVQFLSRAQQEEHDRLVEALDSVRYRRLISDWKAFLERPVTPDAEPRNAGAPLFEVVSRRAWRLSRRLASSAETIDEHSPDELLHQVRIDAKKLRYLVDALPSSYDAADLACVVGSLKKLQRALGTLHDARVQEQRLLACGQALCAAGGPPTVALALGRLVEQARHRRDGLRADGIEKLAQFRTERTRSACRRAFKRARPRKHAR
jgi:CHAD domain-containing protein